MKEIETKISIIENLLDNIILNNPRKIIQGYIHDEPVLRVREDNNEFYFTSKEKV